MLIRITFVLFLIFAGLVSCSETGTKNGKLNEYLSAVKIENLSENQKIELLKITVKTENYSRLAEILYRLDLKSFNELDENSFKKIVSHLIDLKKIRLAESIVNSADIRNSLKPKIAIAELKIANLDFYNFEKYLKNCGDLPVSEISYLIDKYLIFFNKSENKKNLKKFSKIILNFLVENAEREYALNAAKKILTVIQDDAAALLVILKFGDDNKKILGDSELKIKNGSPDLRSLMICGLNEFQKNNLDKSLIYFNQALKTYPYNSDVKNIMSEIYFLSAQEKIGQNSNPVNIAELVLKSVMLDPDNVNALLSLTKIYYNSGMSGEYVKFAERLFYNNYSDANEYQKYVSALLKLKKTESALMFIKNRESAFLSDAGLFNLYLHALEAAGSRSKALSLIKFKQLNSTANKSEYAALTLLYYKYLPASEFNDRIKILEEIIFESGDAISISERSKLAEELSELYYLTNNQNELLKLFLRIPDANYNPVYLSNSILKISDKEIINNLLTRIKSDKIKIDITAYLNLLKKSGAFSEITDFLKDRIKQTSRQDIILFYTGALINLNRIQEAIPYLKKILLINKKNTDALFQMGIVYEKTGDLSAAFKYYNEVKKINPDFADIDLHIILLDWNKEKYEYVIDRLRAMYVSDKSNEILTGKLIECLIEYAVIKDLQNDAQSALNYFNQAYRLEPSNPKLLVNMAEFYLKKKNYDQSLVYYEEYLKRSQNEEIMLTAADIYKITGDYKKMRELLIEILTINPENEKARNKIIENGYDDILIEQDTRIRRSNKILADNKFQPDVIVQNQADLKNKINETLNLISLKPRFYEGYLRLGLYYLQLRDYVKSIENLEKYHKLFNSKESLYYLAAALSKTNRNLESLNYFKELFAKHPQWEKSYKGLINSYLSNYMIQELLEFLAELSKKDYFKNNPEYFSSVFYDISLYYCKTNNFQTALEIISKSEAMFKSISNTRFLKAKIFYIQNRLQECFDSLQNISFIDKNDYLLYNYMIADYYIHKKDFDKAGDIYGIILKMNPSSKVAGFNLDLISGFNGSTSKTAPDGELKTNYEIYKYFTENDYSKIILTNPVSDYVKYYQALALYKTGNSKKSLELFEQINKSKLPVQSEFYYHYALILNKNYLFEKSSDIIKNNVSNFKGATKYEALLLLAENYLKLNNGAAALNLLNNSGFPPEFENAVLNFKGVANFNLRQYEAAAGCFENCLGGSHDNEVLFNLAATYKELGYLEKALEICSELNSKNYADIHKTLTLSGIIYYELGNLEEAETRLKKSLEKKPDQSQARKLISVIQFKKH